MSCAALSWQHEALALVAGGVILTSAVGKWIARFRAYRDGTATRSPSDLWRDSLQCAGNLLWVCFGLLAGPVALTVLCGINAVTSAMLIVFNALAPSQPAQPRR